MNVHLLEIVNAYNKLNQKSFNALPIDKLKNYFLIKAIIAENLKDAAFSLKGLQLTTQAAPFVSIQQQGNTKATITLKDVNDNIVTKSDL